MRTRSEATSRISTSFVPGGPFPSIRMTLWFTALFTRWCSS